MTYPVGQRGLQPLNYRSPSVRLQAAGAKSSGVAGKGASGVKFGGVGQVLQNGGVNVFQNITEVFLWGFLAQDMVAMWMPRVWTSLQEGKKTYDPTEDPAMKDKPFNQQVKAWLKGNTAGLNWVNCWEGTKREIATGPGLLAVPALAFMVNRALMNPGVELSAKSIQEMGEGLGQYLKGKSYGEQEKSNFIDDVKNYLKTGFADIEQVAGQGLPKADAKTSEAAKAAAEKIQKSIADWLDAEIKGSVAHAGRGRFDRLKANTSQAFGKEPNKDLPKLREAVETQMRKFNRDFRMNRYKDALKIIADDAPLNNTGKTWFTYRPDSIESAKKAVGNEKEAVVDKAKKLVTQRDFSHIQADVSRVGGYLNQIWANQAKREGGKIAEVTTKTMQQFIRNKFLLGWGTTILTAGYLVKLAFWAQSHGTYQATRLLNDDAASNGKDKHKNKRSRSSEQPLNTQQPAGLPFGAQPAFSRLGQSFGMPTQAIQSPLAFQTLFQGQRNLRAEGGQV